MLARRRLFCALFSIAICPATVWAVDSDGDGVDDSIDVCCDTPLGVAVDGRGRPIGDLDLDCDVDLHDAAQLINGMMGPMQLMGPCDHVCRAAGDCDGNSYCATPPGDCDGDGVCRPRPEVCPAIYDPVCGCDGRTYGNDCEAAAAGVSIASEGPCRCLTNNDCLTTHFCSHEQGACNSPGVCRERPSVCPDVFDPVCGCDGETYGNACEAASAGVSVNHPGVCACQDNAECDDGDYCRKVAGDCNGQGACAPRPDTCLAIFDPVCGCDGETYSNACQAAAAGVNVKHEGPCGEQLCGGVAGIQCPAGQYCSLPQGQCCCDIEGICAPIPPVCPDIWAPVCGCDGKTYGNRCEAAAAGVSVEHEGICECTTNADCDDTDYCRKASGDCDGRGECAARPEVCPAIFDPVCGCDGATYGNACEAAAAGVNVRHEGPCGEQVCGGIAGIQCPEDHYCSLPEGECCCDVEGLCAPIPPACPDIWAPVCGCDGKTYGNRCEAAAAGVSVEHEGICRCTTNADCGETNYCRKAAGDCDGVGECAPRPEFCPAIFDPVCGCDGETYGNACEAAAAGVNVKHDGPCGEVPCGGIVGTPCPQGQYCSLAEGLCCCDHQGICAVIPQECPDIWAPVCGCDGKTYGNRCEAAAAGVSVDHEGICKCTTNADCDDADYCRKAAGDCDGVGECAARPEVCPAVFDPVCGCDGVTYGNACEAAAAGVNVAREGPCGDQECGGIAGIPCPEGQYCSLSDGKCCCDHVGRCAPVPQGCPDVWDPVCGCDGKTYGNRCEAAAAGVNVDREGICGCTDNSDCLDTHYCRRAAGDCDGRGECAARPDVCPAVFDPVCGCDGETYSNACEAAAAGTNVEHEGPCGDQVCGGIGGIPCPGGQYCSLPDGQCCCDREGTCAPIPQGCPDVWDPVCGCDGRTYGNRCEAAAAGVNVKHEGICRCQANDDCGQGEYCQKPSGACGGDGQCAERPLQCPLLYAPVCGCDGITYSNACFAAAAGANVKHEGTCSDGTPCVGNHECDALHYCERPEGLCTEPGKCHRRPDACPAIFDPVCGCDGNTYGNACEAAAAGVSIAHEGVCECQSNDDCGFDSFCKFPVDECDTVGQCLPRPTCCEDEDAPVCGCDGRTYRNRCTAFQQGVSVDHPGPCALGVCDLPIEVGPCDAAIPRFAFNSATGACELFIYGGCGGNANNFETLEECQRACEPTTVCDLAIDPGPCAAAIPRYAFNNETGRCELFIYGGCAGNNNNFETFEECEQACPPVDRCSLPTEVGPCDAHIVRFTFNSATGQCEQFIYGGCEGNANNFPTLEECQANCAPIDICNLPIVEGPCLAVIPRFGYDAAAGACVPFTYGGCGGNANNFVTLEECQRACANVNPCELPIDPGPCDQDITRYGYNGRLGRCVPFQYGGCQGNANNYATLDECRQACGEVDPCGLDVDPGPCEALIPRYAFNASTGRCERFFYGGCEGNANNFATLAECEGVCPAQDRCALPTDPGPCDAFIVRFTFDQQSQQCHQFIYGGCGGNANNFPSLDQCQQACVPVDRCQLPPDPGPCDGAFQRYYYDAANGDCFPFIYGGCLGNANNFQTINECNAHCRGG